MNCHWIYLVLHLNLDRTGIKGDTMRCFLKTGMEERRPEKGREGGKEVCPGPKVQATERHDRDSSSDTGFYMLEYKVISCSKLVRETLRLRSAKQNVTINFHKRLCVSGLAKAVARSRAISCFRSTQPIGVSILLDAYLFFFRLQPWTLPQRKL